MNYLVLLNNYFHSYSLKMWPEFITSYLSERDDIVLFFNNELCNIIVLVVNHQ